MKHVKIAPSKQNEEVTEMVNWIKPSELPDGFLEKMWVTCSDGEQSVDLVHKHKLGGVVRVVNGGYQLMKDDMFRVAMIEYPEAPIFD